MKKNIVRLTTSVLGVLLMLFAAYPAMAQDKQVTVYCDDNYPPYSYVKNGEAAGIYTDIFKKAFSRMKGYNVTIKPVPWKRGLNLMKQGTGFALYPPYLRPKTRPFMDYPAPVLNEGFSVLTTMAFAKDRNPKWPEDYAGKTIGINTGFSVPQLDKAKTLGVKIEEASNNISNIKKLIHGRLDGYINDANAMLWTLKQLKSKGEYDETKNQQFVVATNISKEQGYLGVTNQDNGKFAFKQDFVSQFTAIIQKMKDNGEIQTILDSYIK